MTLERLCPHPERRSDSETVGASGKSGDLLAVAGEQFTSEARLPDAGFTQHENAAETHSGYPLELLLENGQLRAATDQLWPSESRRTRVSSYRSGGTPVRRRVGLSPRH
jgi:hypothetical protein